MSQYLERVVRRLPHLRRARRLALICCIALCGCSSVPMAPEDRRQICQVEVEYKFDSPVFHANPLSNAQGGLVGAAGGAVQGLAVPNALAWIVTVPLGAVIGGIGGTACAVASQSHPDADADFENILKAADAGYLKRALETDLNAPRADCRRAHVGVSATAPPDTIVEIQNISVGMGCVFGQQEYALVVKWQVLTAQDRRVLGEATTTCSQTSFKDVDEWFADRDQARGEIERVLTKTGQRMASELLSSWVLSTCKFRSTKTGEIEDR
jgi:hypothetical protein